MANLLGHPVLTDGETLDQIVKDYFKKGDSYLEILEYLKTYHGKTMSLSTLKQHFKSENYFRRPLLGRRATYVEVKEVVSEEIRGGGSNLGYRRVWPHLKASGWFVRREGVRLALHELDPENVKGVVTDCKEENIATLARIMYGILTGMTSLNHMV